MNSRIAKCQRTGNKTPIIDGFFAADYTSGEWSFISSSAPGGVNEYWTAVEDICKSPEALIDWIAHLNEKTWFSPQKFTDFFSRFREENSLYGAL